MAGRLCDIIPAVEELLRLEPEEVGSAILKTLLVQRGPLESRPSLVGFLGRLYDFRSEQYPRQYKTEVEDRVTEAWQWLENQGFLVPETGINGTNGYRRVSRQGEAFAAGRNAGAFATARILPRDLVHAAIHETIYAPFLRGEYGTAIFEAFKEVEVAVRVAGNLPPELLGTDLMRKAFAPEGGPLADGSAPKGEREALAHLIAGAIGSYKNPLSHRHVSIPSAEEAAEIIILASHLLRIVEARAAKKPCM